MRPLPLLLAIVSTVSGPAGGGDAIFVDRASAAGLDFVYFNGMSGEYFMPEMVGGGAALFDYDNDGDLDVYLVQGQMLGERKQPSDATFPPRGPLHDRLFRNDLHQTENGEPVLRFTEVTAESGLRAAGYGIGVATGDVDNDGWTDLYVTGFGPNQLWRNRGDGTFEDWTRVSRTGEPRWSVAALFADIDRDGWLDLFVANYVDFTIAANRTCRTLSGVDDYCGPLSFKPVPDRLWRNLGHGIFEDISTRAGILSHAGSALGAVAGDFNEDGWPDIYVANDGVPNYMWINQRDGTFRDEALLAGTAVNMMGRPEASMGVALGDFDGDGDEDLFLTHLRNETNTLYLNGGGGFYEDATTRSGLGPPSWSLTGFGTAWLDYDNDGLLDLLVANGAVHLPEGIGDSNPAFPLDEPNLLFHNVGGGRFQDVTRQAGAAVSLREVSRGVAAGDVDNDGDTDLLVVNNSGPVRLLINQVGAQNGWLGIRAVEGDPPRDSLGARVCLVLRSREPLWRRVATDGSYASASDPRVLFGLAKTKGIEAVVVVWPDGSRESFAASPGRYTTLYKGTGKPEPGKP